ncbi:MAG TPA: hypothetical protein VLG37_04405 [Candidatus Saccharimonadales bacterium]|nr:hypothetical protein [Candidatus Saccharimonadales bacterium]
MISGPGNGDLPPRLRFGQEAADLRRTMFLGALTVVGYEANAVMDLSSSEMGTLEFVTYPAREDYKVAVPFLGADQIMVKSLYHPLGSIEKLGKVLHVPAQVIELELFRGGKPYVLESDREESSYAVENWYAVFSSPELAPLAIQAGYLYDVEAENSQKTWGMMEDVQRVIDRFGKEAVHFLSDTDCENLLAAIKMAGKRIDYKELSGILSEILEDS